MFCKFILIFLILSFNIILKFIIKNQQKNILGIFYYNKNNSVFFTE